MRQITFGSLKLKLLNIFSVGSRNSSRNLYFNPTQILRHGNKNIAQLKTDKQVKTQLKKHNLINIFFLIYFLRCVESPEEVCHGEYVNPRLVRRPVVKLWCKGGKKEEEKNTKMNSFRKILISKYDA